MICGQALKEESAFMHRNIPLLLNRFTLSYFKEDCCIEYFINNKNTGELISSSLVFAYNPATRDMHISRFHPELIEQPDSKYMSAACFYIFVHHCAECYQMNNSCHISLETVPKINDGFYKKLLDFNFHISKNGLGNVVELVSDIERTDVDTAMIKEHRFDDGEVPFLKW